jgi:hypothetical protein
VFAVFGVGVGHVFDDVAVFGVGVGQVFAVFGVGVGHVFDDVFDDVFDRFGTQA